MTDNNDPRVLFAAERTLLAWNRTSISLMAFGFVVERFGLFQKIMGLQKATVCLQHNVSFCLGISFILLGSFISFSSAWQYRKILQAIGKVVVPGGYRPATGMFVNIILGVLGLGLSAYLIGYGVL